MFHHDSSCFITMSLKLPHNWGSIGSNSHFSSSSPVFLGGNIAAEWRWLWRREPAPKGNFPSPSSWEVSDHVPIIWKSLKGKIHHFLDGKIIKSPFFRWDNFPSILINKGWLWMIPSGQHTKNHGKSQWYSWENQLFYVPFSIAMLNCQRISLNSDMTIFSYEDHDEIIKMNSL